MLVRSPTRIGVLSARITAPNQMPTSRPSRASPITSAEGATQLDPSSGKEGRSPSISYRGIALSWPVFFSPALHPRVRFLDKGPEDCMALISVLDLVRVRQGSDIRTALDATRDLAAYVETLGYTRFWVAEHHNMPGIASAATSVVIGHIAAGTQRIRVGAGGIMLPNHSPLVIAEQFGTLETLFPGRIDLGLGRAPGSDQVTARALRRNLASDPDQFPQDVLELMGYFAPQGREQQRVMAVPGAGLNVPIWILGSSLF